MEKGRCRFYESLLSERPRKYMLRPGIKSGCLTEDTQTALARASINFAPCTCRGQIHASYQSLRDFDDSLSALSDLINNAFSIHAAEQLEKSRTIKHQAKHNGKYWYLLVVSDSITRRTRMLTQMKNNLRSLLNSIRFISRRTKISPISLS
jgi:hypothetical protein